VSDKARAYVEEFSPYQGNGYLIHYVMGTLANDTYGFRLFIGDVKMARKCRCSVKSLQRHRAQMIEDGFLEVIDATTGPGRFAEYRFLMPLRTTVVILSTVDDPNGGQNSPIPDTNGGHSADPLCLLETSKKQGAAASDDPTISSLSALLVSEIERFAGYRPKITKTWTKELGDLLRLGPRGREKPEPLTPERVERCIRYVFTHLATPGKPSNGHAVGFCWAGVIKSPGALREHWNAIASQARQARQSKRPVTDDGYEVDERARALGFND
jgi:hypothetical protein